MKSKVTKKLGSMQKGKPFLLINWENAVLFEIMTTVINVATRTSTKQEKTKKWLFLEESWVIIFFFYLFFCNQVCQVFFTLTFFLFLLSDPLLHFVQKPHFWSPGNCFIWTFSNLSFFHFVLQYTNFYYIFSNICLYWTI